MLDKLFKSLKSQKDNYLSAHTGKDFEDRIETFLKMSLGLTRILKRDLDTESWKTIQNHIKNKLADNYINIPNPNLKRSYIHQPYGSQQFPDFLIFTDEKVIPLEIKFSKSQPKPVWNSNIPKANGFYVFGSYGIRDITFFEGSDVVTPEHRKALYGFFEEIKKIQDEVRETMPELDSTNRGFTPYIRAAFEQKNHKENVNTNFFTHPDREKTENLVISKTEKL